MTTGPKIETIPMKLSEIASFLPVSRGLPADLEVTGLTSDSRAVRPGMIFVAVPGTKADGSAYAVDAEARGAVAVVAGKAAAVGGLLVPVIAVDDPRLALSAIAARFF